MAANHDAEIAALEAELAEEEAKLAALTAEGKEDEAKDVAKHVKKLNKKINKKKEEAEAEAKELERLDGLSLSELNELKEKTVQEALDAKGHDDKHLAVEKAKHAKLIQAKIEEKEAAGGGAAAEAPAAEAATDTATASADTAAAGTSGGSGDGDGSAGGEGGEGGEKGKTAVKSNAERYAAAAERQAAAREAELSAFRATPRDSYEDAAPTRHTQSGDVPAWICQQIRAFTGWVNYVLASRGLYLDREIASAFDDGLSLIPFVEILTEDKAMKHQKKPKFRVHKVENVTIALQLLKQHGFESQTSVEDFCDANEKMILGFIYQLFVKFVGGEQNKKINGRDFLLEWVQGQVNGGKYPDVEVNNWTSDWQSGLAVCALLNSLSDNFLDMHKLKASKPIPNHIKGYHSANVNLGIPQLLDPFEMVENEPDDKAVQMYVMLIKAAWEKKGREAAEKAAADAARRAAMPKEEVWQIVDELREMLSGGRCPQCGYCFSTLDEREDHGDHDGEDGAAAADE